MSLPTGLFEKYKQADVTRITQGVMNSLEPAYNNGIPTELASVTVTPKKNVGKSIVDTLSGLWNGALKKFDKPSFEVKHNANSSSLILVAGAVVVALIFMSKRRGR